jgi:PadR family transcriptional regulator PadR
MDLMKATGLPSGTLYPVLVRLEQAGWVEAAWEDLDPVAAGRPARRYYGLTADGVRAARLELAELHAQTGAATTAIRTAPAPGSAS